MAQTATGVLRLRWCMTWQKVSHASCDQHQLCCVCVASFQLICSCAALVGDITPDDGISKEEKNRRETAAIEQMTELLGGTIGAPRLCGDQHRPACTWTMRS